jgi:hypothetical protein
MTSRNSALAQWESLPSKLCHCGDITPAVMRPSILAGTLATYTYRVDRESLVLVQRRSTGRCGSSGWTVPPIEVTGIPPLVDLCLLRGIWLPHRVPHVRDHRVYYFRGPWVSALGFEQSICPRVGSLGSLGRGLVNTFYYGYQAD